MLFSRKLRNEIINLISLFTKKKIILPFLWMIFYVAICIFIFREFNFWSPKMLKDTLFWFFTSCLVLFFNVNNIKDNSFIKTILFESFKLALVAEFLLNLYTFSLAVELILVPSVIFISLLITVANTNTEFNVVKKFLSFTIGLIGLFLWIYLAVKTYQTSFNDFNNSMLQSFSLPILLTISILPFLYFFAVFMQYESFFIRINCMTKNIEKATQIKKAVKKTAKLNLSKLNMISKRFLKIEAFSSQDVFQYISSLINQK